MEDLIEFSSAFGSPKINLRDAEILDSYGSTERADMTISHISPMDVTLDEFEYYGPSVFAFMNLKDLIFYTYAVFTAYEQDYGFGHMSYLLYNYDRSVEELQELLSSEQRLTLINACKYLYELHGFHADWVGAKDFSEFIGVDVSEATVQKWFDENHPKT